MKNVLFLDRDGVINKKLENNYVKIWSEFEFLPGVFSALKLFSLHFDLIIVSNQAGVAKNFMTYSDLLVIDKKMQQEISLQKVSILKTYYCPHQDTDACDCRKPKPGLFLQAQKDFNFCLAQAWVIGDSERDIVAGKKAGCKYGILISDNSAIITQADFVTNGLLNAAKIVLSIDKN
jgi:D-glycero-D-manno-heptose 1,7-bisphosphate phosphatase